jgi:uncharacterized protein YeaO (DUF488 family)
MPNSNIETYRLRRVTARLGEGGSVKALHIGVVRYLPRGVKKEDYARLGYFDIWLAQLAPSRELVKAYKAAADNDNAWKAFAAAYRKEVNASAETKQLIKFIAIVAARISVVIGCYCEDELRCHRSILKGLIDEAKEK